MVNEMVNEAGKSNVIDMDSLRNRSNETSRKICIHLQSWYGLWLEN